MIKYFHFVGRWFIQTLAALCCIACYGALGGLLRLLSTFGYLGEKLIKVGRQAIMCVYVIWLVVVFISGRQTVHISVTM